MIVEFNKNQIKKDFNGWIIKVNDLNGNRSILYDSFYDYLKHNRVQLNAYDTIYFRQLINSKLIPSLDISSMTLGQLALGFYLKIYSTVYLEVFGDWINEEKVEPSFDKIKNVLLTDEFMWRHIRKPELINFYHYEPSALEVIAIINEETPLANIITVEETLQISKERGIFIPKDIMRKLFLVMDLDPDYVEEQLYKDLRSRSYTITELFHLYKTFDISITHIEEITADIDYNDNKFLPRVELGNKKTTRFTKILNYFK